jgi:hypothetical protein
VPSRRPRPRPTGGGGLDPEAIQLQDDQFAVDLASDSVGLVEDDQVRLLGDDASDDDDVDDGPLGPDVVERMAQEELSEVLAGFKARERTEEQRFHDATDTEYWFALCFQTREQKEEFLHKMGWADLGDKYLDGMAAAERSNVELTSRIPPMPTHRVDRQLADLVE